MARPRVEKRVGQADCQTSPKGGRCLGSAKMRWSRPTSHKVVWDHSSSRGVGLISIGFGRLDQRRARAGGRVKGVRFKRTFYLLVHVLSTLFQEHRKYRHASLRPSYALHERRRHFFLFTSNWHPYLSQTFGLSLNLPAQVAPRHSLFLQTQVIFFLHLLSVRIL